VAANTGSSARSATLTIAGKSFTVNQAGSCSYTVSPLSITVGSGVDGGTLTVTTQSGCAWTSVSQVSWITMAGTGPGSGNTFYTTSANTGSTQRIGTILVAGKTVTVTQPGSTTRPSPPSSVRIIR
jgi:hypothetical protein